MRVRTPSYDVIFSGSQCCCVGVSHLRLMLTARTPLKKDEEVAARDPSLPLLLHQGGRGGEGERRRSNRRRRCGRVSPRRLHVKYDV